MTAGHRDANIAHFAQADPDATPLGVTMPNGTNPGPLSPEALEALVNGIRDVIYANETQHATVYNSTAARIAEDLKQLLADFGYAPWAYLVQVTVPDSDTRWAAKPSDPQQRWTLVADISQAHRFDTLTAATAAATEIDRTHTGRTGAATVVKVAPEKLPHPD